MMFCVFEEKALNKCSSNQSLILTCVQLFSITKEKVTPNFESKVAGKLKVCKRTVRILLQWSYTLSFSRLFVMNFGCKPRKECGNQGKIERLLSFACSKELGG